MIKTEGLKKADILKSLYNRSKPQGMGMLHFQPEDMTTEEAEKLLLTTKDFDYLKGRVMKVDLNHDSFFEEWLYDRDNGPGAAQRAIDSIK